MHVETPMNIHEHLLTCLIEEAAEVQQAASKSLRFGLDDNHPDSDRTNRQDLADELTGLLAVIDLCRKYGMKLPEIGNPGDMEDKQDRVNKTMNYATDQGTLSK